MANGFFQFADQTALDTGIAGGAGTLGDPLLISDDLDFNRIRDYLDKVFSFVNDIDFSVNYPTNWTRIANTFTGTILGNGFKASNFTQNTAGMGIFFNFAGEMSELTFDNMNVTFGASSTGVFANIVASNNTQNATLIDVILDGTFTNPTTGNGSIFFANMSDTTGTVTMTGCEVRGSTNNTGGQTTYPFWNSLNYFNKVLNMENCVVRLSEMVNNSPGNANGMVGFCGGLVLGNASYVRNCGVEITTMRNNNTTGQTSGFADNIGLYHPDAEISGCYVFVRDMISTNRANIAGFTGLFLAQDGIFRDNFVRVKTMKRESGNSTTLQGAISGFVHSLPSSGNGIIHCYTHIDEIIQTATITGTGGEIAGFIGAGPNSSTTGLVEYCYALIGKITTSSSYVGGFQSRKTGTTQNCYAIIGEIEQVGGTSLTNLGGFASILSSGTIDECFAATTNIIDSVGWSNVGLFIGQSSGTVSNCYVQDIPTPTYGGLESFATILSEADMKKEASFSGWTFSSCI